MKLKLHERMFSTELTMTLYANLDGTFTIFVEKFDPITSIGLYSYEMNYGVFREALNRMGFIESKNNDLHEK